MSWWPTARPRPEPPAARPCALAAWCRALRTLQAYTCRAACLAAADNGERMKTEHAPTIQRADYRPLAWSVESIDLHFKLDADATMVTSRMVCVRNPAAADEGPILLWGEALERISLKLDDAALAAEAVREADGVLQIDAAGERAVLEI